MKGIKVLKHKRVLAFILALVLMFLYVDIFSLASILTGSRNIEVGYLYKNEGDYSYESAIYNDTTGEIPAPTHLTLADNERIVAYKIVLANRSFDDLEEYIEDGGEIIERGIDELPRSTPSDATPSDATPSDATPSNATPSNATSSDATPSDTPRDFVIYDLGEEYVIRPEALNMNIFSGEIFNRQRNLYIGIMPIVYEINGIEEVESRYDVTYTIRSNKNFILKYNYNGEEVILRDRNEYIITKPKISRGSSISFTMMYNERIDFFSDSRDIEALYIPREDNYDGPVVVEPQPALPPQNNENIPQLPENQNTLGNGQGKNESADTKFYFDLKGVSKEWNTFIPKWEFKNIENKKAYYKLWNKSIGETEGSVKTILYKGENLPIILDGIYGLKVWWEDDKGNKFDETIKEFKIDRFSPNIDVNFNVTDGKNHYNKERIAEIKITEGNFDISKVKITIRDEATGRFIIPEYKFFKDKAVNTAKISFEKSGRYSLSVEASDLSGKVAQDYKSEIFTIDLEKPEVSIRGVVNLSSNKEIPSISISFSDKNIDIEKSSVTLKSMSSKESHEFKKSARFINGKYEIASLGDIEDDTYMLQADIYDLAGNNANEKIVFSINTKGATFAFKPSEIIGSYTNKDFLPRIEIWNTDEVSIISATINGVEESYKYVDEELVFDREISVEGKYVFNLDVVDTAGNKTSMPTVELVLDKTAPIVVIDGIEDEAEVENEVVILISTLNNLDEVTKIELDGEKIENLKNNKKLKVNKPGEHILYIEATDKAGNVGEKSIKFSVKAREGDGEAYILRRDNTKIFVAFIGIMVAGLLGYIVLSRKSQKKK